MQWRSDDESLTGKRQCATEAIAGDRIACYELLALRPGRAVKLKKIDGSAETAGNAMQWRPNRKPAIVQRQCAAEAISGNRVASGHFVPLHPGNAIEFEEIDRPTRAMQWRADRKPAIAQRQCAAEAVARNNIGADQFLALHPRNAIEGEDIDRASIPAVGVVQRRTNDQRVLTDCDSAAKLRR
jgi:hypothetical protein